MKNFKEFENHGKTADDAVSDVIMERYADLHLSDEGKERVENDLDASAAVTMELLRRYHEWASR